MVKGRDIKQTAIVLSFYVAGSVLGPMIFFGLIGYFIDNQLETRPLYMLVFIGIAFVTSNALLIKKVMQITRKETK